MSFMRTIGGVLLGCFSAVSGTWPVTASQEQSSAKAAFCDHDQALYVIEQQLGEIDQIEDKSERMLLLAKAADILWLYRETQAREVFKARARSVSARGRKEGWR